MIRFLLVHMCIILAWQGMSESKHSGYPDDIICIDYRPEPSEAQPDIIFAGQDENIYSITLPLKRAGNLILLDAIIDSVPGNLILDTGSAALVLNSIWFREGRRSASFVAGGVTGSAGAVTRGRVNDMQLSGISFHGLDANITDLGHIEQARNVKVLGFFGLSMLRDFEVVVDLNNNFLELHRLDSQGRRINPPQREIRHDISLPVRVESNVMFLDAEIAGRKLTFCLDTGAESNVISSHLPNRVLSTIDIFRRSNLRGAGGQNVEVLYGFMNDFSIEKTVIRGMNIIITNLTAMSQSYGVRIDGMLGCDFFEKGVFYINMRQNRLGIVLN
jgi:hypothetical protein